MYKIFEVTYNDGDWHSGGLPHFFYIAKSEEEVMRREKNLIANPEITMELESLYDKVDNLIRYIRRTT